MYSVVERENPAQRILFLVFLHFLTRFQSSKHDIFMFFVYKKIKTCYAFLVARCVVCKTAKQDKGAIHIGRADVCVAGALPPRNPQRLTHSFNVPHVLGVLHF